MDSSKANYHYSNVGKPTPVGRYAANGYGLYDMSGNVSEWCLDEYDEDFYGRSGRRNPVLGVNNIKQLLDNYTNIKSHRVLRGGSWDDKTHYLRVAARAFNTPSGTDYLIGFRCVRSVTP